MIESYEEYIKGCYDCRPNEEECHIKENEYERSIQIRCKFPKTIKKRTYIVSEFGPVTMDAVEEFLALHALKKPIDIAATSGRWEGRPFCLFTTDDVEITLEDEEFIDDYKKHLRLVYNDE